MPKTAIFLTASGLAKDSSFALLGSEVGPHIFTHKWVPPIFLLLLKGNRKDYPPFVVNARSLLFVWRPQYGKGDSGSMRERTPVIAATFRVHPPRVAHESWTWTPRFEANSAKPMGLRARSEGNPGMALDPRCECCCLKHFLNLRVFVFHPGNTPTGY